MEANNNGLKRIKMVHSSWEKWNGSNSSSSNNHTSLVDLLFDLDDDGDISTSKPPTVKEIEVDIFYLSRNQFDFNNGGTACTSISFVACLHFLKKKDPKPESMSWNTIMK